MVCAASPLQLRAHHRFLILRERGYEEFAPSYKVEKRWSDRTKQIEQFLFPGYIFCRFNPNDRLSDPHGARGCRRGWIWQIA